MIAPMAPGLAILLNLLAYPSLWIMTNGDPPTICQGRGETCLIHGPHEVLVTQREGDQVTITPLTGSVADAARNLIVLRAADAMALARDRAERARMEQRQ